MSRTDFIGDYTRHLINPRLLMPDPGPGASPAGCCFMRESEVPHLGTAFHTCGAAAPVYAYLASDLARDVTGQILIAAGGFVGRFDRPTPRVLGYRDHHAAGSWSVEDLRKMIGAGATT